MLAKVISYTVRCFVFMPHCSVVLTQNHNECEISTPENYLYTVKPVMNSILQYMATEIFIHHSYHKAVQYQASFYKINKALI